VGLLIASVLAANMAGCSAFMVDSGALFTRNFYRKYLVKLKQDAHYLWVGRISGLAITLGAVVYALFFVKRVLYSFLLTETMATFVGVSVLGGVFWRRGTRWGAISSIAVAMCANFSLYHFRNQRFDHWDPNVFLGALASGVVTYIVVSLLTPREPATSLDSFYQRLQTPSDGAVEEGHLAPPSAAETRAYAEAGRQLILVNLFRLRQGAAGVPMLRAYRIDIKGFLIGWTMALALVAAAWLLFNL
jgi:SSS family solute:Na+ symporter